MITCLFTKFVGCFKGGRKLTEERQRQRERERERESERLKRNLLRIPPRRT